MGHEFDLYMNTKLPAPLLLVAVAISLRLIFPVGICVSSEETKNIDRCEQMKSAPMPYRPSNANADDIKNYEMVIKMFAKCGHEYAQFELGLMYSNGYGVAKDDRLALNWYRKAADQGHINSQLALALAYRKGQGVEKNGAQVVYWCRKAAEQGNAVGQFNLGIQYAIGSGVKKDHRQAFVWFRKAAEQGLSGAQAVVGRMYKYGEGVEKDINLAIYWLQKAANQGDESARKDLDNLILQESGQ